MRRGSAGPGSSEQTPKRDEGRSQTDTWLSPEKSSNLPRVTQQVTTIVSSPRSESQWQEAVHALPGSQSLFPFLYHPHRLPMIRVLACFPAASGGKPSCSTPQSPAASPREFLHKIEDAPVAQQTASSKQPACAQEALVHRCHGSQHVL